MKRFFLTIVLSIFFGSLIAQITPEDNQITIQKLDSKIKTINAKNNNLKLQNKSFEASLILQEKKIDSLINILQVSNNKIVNNKNSLGEANQQINLISQESEAFCTKMDNTTLYFAISLVVLLMLIVLVLIVLNLKRKKEVNRLSEKITELDMELINKIKETKTVLNKELIETNEKLVVEISKNKTLNEKQNEDIKNVLSKNLEELKLLIDEINQKFENKLHKNITGIESNIEKLQDAVYVDIANVSKNIDNEFAKIRKEIKSLAKKIVPKEK